MVNFLPANETYLAVKKNIVENDIRSFSLEKYSWNGTLQANASFDAITPVTDAAGEGLVRNIIIKQTPGGDIFLVADVFDMPANLTSSREDDPYYIDFNVLVVKMNSTLNTQWAWVMGGNSMESVRDIAVDTEGNLYVFGLTTSYNFPTTTNAFQPLPGNFDWRFREDFFLSKFTVNGSLSWSTFVGGISSDLPIGMVLANDTLIISGYTESRNFPVGVNDQLWKNDWIFNLVMTEFSLDGELLHTNFVFQESFLAGSPNSWFSAGGLELLDDGSFVVAADVYVAGMEKYESVDNLYSYNISRSYPFDYEEPFLRMVVRINASFSPVWVTGFVRSGEDKVYYNHMQNIVQVNDSVAVTMYEPRYNASYVALLDVNNGTVMRMGNTTAAIVETVEHEGKLYVVGVSGTTGIIGELKAIPVPQKTYPEPHTTVEPPASQTNSTEEHVNTTSTVTITVSSAGPASQGSPSTPVTSSSTPISFSFLLMPAVLVLRRIKKDSD